MNRKAIKILKIGPRRTTTEALFQRWETFVPENPISDYRSPYRLLGLFKTDSINFSFEEASRRRVRNELLG